jgi:hypothetical protein
MAGEEPYAFAGRGAAEAAPADVMPAPGPTRKGNDL